MFARLVPLALALAVAAPALAQEIEGARGNADWQDKVESLLAANAGHGRLDAPMMLCQDTACARVDTVALGPEEAALIRQPLAEAPDPEAERRGLAAAIARFEGFVGARLGTWADKPRNDHAEDEPGQMDCVDEATNTRTLLDRLAAEGLLRHHRVEGFAIRYLIVLQHVAVEMAEIASGDRWVVDSWVGANGEEPSLQPYLEWRMELLVDGGPAHQWYAQPGLT